jgi:Hemopexin
VIDYFFSGNQYIRVSRGDTGPGSLNAGYPAPISNWNWPAGFATNGIDAALYSGSKCYFFSGDRYIRVSRGVTGPGSVDPGYPAPISNWNWPNGFGANGIDAALWSGSVCYFFKGSQYIRVRRGDTGPGTVDPGYPAPISNWNWGPFGAQGIDGALYSGSKCYFFSGNQYVRVSRADQGPGLLDAGYPAPISNWNWGSFGAQGIRAPLYSGGPLLAPPSGGLISNSNYFLDDGGAALTDVSVTVNFDVDFVSSANAYSFQLNCYSTEGQHITTEWQQFVVYASPNSSELWARIDTWSGTQLTDELNRIDVALANMPSTTIKAGYAFNISLNADTSGNVTGATYTVWDNTGKSLGSTTIGIVGQKLRTTGQPATAANLAPIAALTFNVGGDYGGSTATLTGGAGTITYAASNALTAANAEPSYTDFDDNTAENANLIFGPLPETANQVITQSFQATTVGAALAAQEHPVRPHGHVLPPPDNLSLGRHALLPPDDLSLGRESPQTFGTR